MTMRRIDLQPLEPFTSDFIDRTGAFNPGALEAATAIIEQVRRDGDAALRALTEKFDGVAIENFRVPGEAIDAAMAEVDPDTLEALKHAAAQIRDFHERQKQQSWFFAREDGAIVGSKVTPLESVGIYVPGGRALYPSTVLMNIIPAKVAGVGRIVLDSRIELARVNEIAGRLGVVQDVYMRITPGVEADTHEYIRTGCEDSKFGFTMREDFAFKCVGDVLAAENVRLVGLHCHIGSQIFALHSFREAAAVMVEFMARIRDTYGHEITELDLGGGLGIAYLAEHQPSSIDDFAEVTCSAVRDLCALHNLPLPRLLVEPGRSLVAPAGVTLYTVGILKTLPGIRKYVAIDGGMSDNIRTALYHADYEPTIANKAGQPREEIVTLCGKHCESGDAVVIDMPLQKADLGDIVCVFGTGAYNMTMASNYNGQPRPAVVFVRDGASRVVTRRETYEDLYQRDL